MDLYEPNNNIKSFIDAAIHSADAYCKYLNQNDLGKNDIPVTRIQKEQHTFLLTLGSAPKFPDSLQIRMYNKVFTNEEIRVLEYNEKTKQLRIRPIEELYESLSTAHPSDISAVSDLTFLIDRLKAWYRFFGKNIKYPSVMPSMSAPELTGSAIEPSEEQLNAIKGIFSNPFTYVWGAPGTGKTRFVLSHCVSAYYQRQKHIIITAPTNNALEQTLYGVLSVFETLGISPDRIIRLGVPSDAFNAKYPDLCEDKNFAKAVSDIDDQLNLISKQIADAESSMKRLSEYDLFKKESKGFIDCINELPPLVDRLVAARNEHQRIIGVLSRCVQQIDQYKLKKNSIENAISSTDSQINSLHEKINKNSSWIRKKLFGSRYNEYINELDKRLTSRNTFENELCNIKNLILEKEKLKSSLETDRLSCFAQISDIEASIKSLIGSSTHFSSLRSNIHSYDNNQLYDYVQNKISNLKSIMDEREVEFSEMSGIDETSLRKVIHSLHEKKNDMIEQKNKLLRSEQSTNYKNYLVVACTTDLLLHRIRSTEFFIPDHIFLDEAGYCSLIKAVPLLSFDCPVTFLGDHMQLPPICEMSDSIMEKQVAYHYVSYWSQSALHAEDIFTLDPAEITKQYFTHAHPFFAVLLRFNLTQTYRFGEELANVLDNHVYQNGFKGNPAHSTDIFYIHASKQEPASLRLSTSEAIQICSYIKHHPDENIAILAPYKKQVKTIRERLLLHHINPADIVFTVHGSQGREWDTVILSVTDTTNMFFTNSRLQASNGLCLLNTAVSRARKKLVLVCDTDYWKTQEQQFIYSLLSVAKEFQ